MAGLQFFTKEEEIMSEEQSFKNIDEKFLKQLHKILLSKMIPVNIIVFDEKTKEEIDRKLVGCYSVPQINEIIAYGETRLQILGVRHTFYSPSGFLSQTIEIAAQECSE